MKKTSPPSPQLEIPVFDEQGRPLSSEKDSPEPAPLNAFAGDLARHVASLPQAWQEAFVDEAVRNTLQRLDAFLDKRLAHGVVIFPHHPLRALYDTMPQDVRVVIIGQDPYHGPDQAQGLAFSVPDHCRTPPSLRNMFRELSNEYPDTFTPQRNNLARWAKQGVLLLNTSLTVEAHQAGSHAKRGWEIVTDAILKHVLRQPRPKVLLLWGAHAQSKQSLLDTQPPTGAVKVLCANHPSPLSATRPPIPFMGCGHFLAANAWLSAQGEQGIDWLDEEAVA